MQTKRLSWYRRLLSRIVARYPFPVGKWRLRKATARWLVAKIDRDVFIRVSGVVDAEWSFLDGKGKEDRTVAWLHEVLRTGMTVVDVGANIGYISLICAPIVGERGRVISFEPTPAVAQRLRENIYLNGFNNVTVIEAAVTDRNCRLTLFECPDDPEGNTIFPNDHGRQIEVAAVTLDSALLRENVTKVDLIKVDAEGAEVRVLDGSQRLLASPSRPLLLFEANPFALEAAGATVEGLLDSVRSRGYRAVEIEGGQWKGRRVANYAAHPVAAGEQILNTAR